MFTATHNVTTRELSNGVIVTATVPAYWSPGAAGWFTAAGFIAGDTIAKVEAI